MRRALALLLLVLCLPPAGAAGCAADKLALRKDEDEQADLGQRAGLYWQALRWGDAAGAAVFIEDEAESLRFQQWVEDERHSLRLSEATVLRVELHNPPSEPETRADGSRVLRRGTVVARTEGYALPAQVLREETVSQEWYRTELGWYLEWSGG